MPRIDLLLNHAVVGLLEWLEKDVFSGELLCSTNYSAPSEVTEQFDSSLPIPKLLDIGWSQLSRLIWPPLKLVSPRTNFSEITLTPWKICSPWDSHPAKAQRLNQCNPRLGRCYGTCKRHTPHVYKRRFCRNGRQNRRNGRQNRDGDRRIESDSEMTKFEVKEDKISAGDEILE